MRVVKRCAILSNRRGAGRRILAYGQSMQEELLNALRFRRPQIRDRWAELLHVEPAASPLGHPDALVHLLDWTLDEIDRALTQPAIRRRIGRRPVHAAVRFECPCGRNPLLAYFAAGQQVMQEGLVLAQAATPALDPFERDASLEELTQVLQEIARREIEAFCGVCQYRDRSHEAEDAVPLSHPGDTVAAKL